LSRLSQNTFTQLRFQTRLGAMTERAHLMKAKSDPRMSIGPFWQRCLPV
jgi:hypothetical protein